VSEAAKYLGLSEWMVRALEAKGIINRVRIPLPDHGEVKRVLFDRQELDALVEAWKYSSQN
jgi:hypothetical protein